MEPLLFDALPSTSCALVAEQLSQLKLNATRWLSAAATPRTPLEEAAAAIFSFHTRSMSFDASQSGAEFWVQSHLESKSIGVPLHRDFDLGALEAEGRTDLFPAVSTITYFSSSPSMPTILLTNFTQGKTVRDSVAREAWAVFPRAGKHLAAVRPSTSPMPPAKGSTRMRGPPRDLKARWRESLDGRSERVARPASAAPARGTA
jgi:hypothetical protein